MRFKAVLLICIAIAPLTTPCDTGSFRPPDALLCQQCTPCEVDEQFLTRPCNATHNAICANCTVCVQDHYELSPCEGTHDTVCKPCSACVPGVSFATGDCGPESSSDRTCSPCSRCALEISPCDSTHDAVCGTLVTLVLASQVPASAFTRAMLSALGTAVASGLGLASSAVEVMEVYRRQMSFTVTANLRIRAAVSPQQVEAMDRAAVARASGLPITLLSASIQQNSIQLKTPPTAPPNALYTGLTAGVILGTVLVFVCVMAGVHRKRRRRRKVADGFTDLSAVVLMQAEEPLSVRRARSA